MSEICSMCGRKIRLKKTSVRDGYICGGCLDRLSINLYTKKDQYTGPELLELLKPLEAKAESRMAEVSLNPFAKKGDDKFDEVRKYKELLDQGIITEEEYEAKRKELLGV